MDLSKLSAFSLNKVVILTQVPSCFRVSPKTLLTYCTNGVLLRTLMGNEHALNTVTHVIVVRRNITAQLEQVKSILKDSES